MQYTVRANDTWNSVAASQTMGGSAYAPAVAMQNDFPFGTVLTDSSGAESTVDGDSKIIDVRDSITIPDEWLKTSGSPIQATVSPSSYQFALLAGAGVIMYLLFDK